MRKSEYHHGDLRQACVDAGVRVLRTEGKDAVSLRALARRAGVSPRAPYRHFADKTALLAAIAQVGFEEFGQALLSAGRRGGSSGPKRLEVLASAYLTFSRANPEMMQLMFGNDFPDRPKRFPALHQAALATFATLEQELKPLGPGSALNAAIAWSLVHGLSDLSRTEQFAHVLPSKRAQRALVSSAVAVFLAGVTARRRSRSRPRTERPRRPSAK